MRGLLRSLGGDGTVTYMWGGNSNQNRGYYKISSSSLSCNASNLDGCVSFRVDRPEKSIYAPANPHFTYHAGVSYNGKIFDAVYGDSYVIPSFTETAPGHSVRTNITYPTTASITGYTCPH